jgi:hypothetical protein
MVGYYKCWAPDEGDEDDSSAEITHIHAEYAAEEYVETRLHYPDWHRSLEGEGVLVHVRDVATGEIETFRVKARHVVKFNAVRVDETAGT